VGRLQSLAGLLAAAGLLMIASANAFASDLKFTGASGATIRFSGTPAVRCVPWEPGADARILQVQLRNANRSWELRAVLADVAAGQRIHFPTSIVDAHPHGALLFVAQRRPLIEASTNEEEASGWLSFSQASCLRGATVAFTVHAVLGSELFEGRKVRVDGTFTGTVG